MIMAIQIGQIFSSVISLVVCQILFPKARIGYESIVFVILGFVAFISNIVPLLAEMLYLLFAWPENYTKRVLEYWNLTISSLLILANVVMISSMAFFNGLFGDAFFVLVTIVQLLHITQYFNAMTKRAPAALRYIDPSWDDAS